MNTPMSMDTVTFATETFRSVTVHQSPLNCGARNVVVENVTEVGQAKQIFGSDVRVLRPRP